MNKNVLSLLATSMSMLLLSDCSASCLEDLDQGERNTSNKVAVQNNVVVSSTTPLELSENQSRSGNSVVAFFEGMPQENHRKFLIKLGISPKSVNTNYYDWSGFKSDDPAKVEEATARWERAQQFIQKGNEDAARGVAFYLWESGKLEECRAHIESLCLRQTHDSAQKFGMYAKVEGYTNGDFGFDQAKDPSKARAILEQGKSEQDDYLTHLYWKGVMEGTYGFPNPENISAFHEGLFNQANAGDKKLRQLIIEGYWLGCNSFPKDFVEGRKINDLYIEEELKESFDWKLRDSSAIIRKLKGLTLDSRFGDMYCYKGDIHALEQFLEKLKTDSSIEVKAFANFLHTALKDEMEIKKSRQQEALRQEEERKRQEEFWRQEAERRSKETKVDQTGTSVTISPSPSNGKVTFSEK